MKPTGGHLNSLDIQAAARSWLETDAVKPCVDKTFWLDAAALVHKYLEAGKHVGKIILCIRQERQQ
ncbi:zinc-binding dehydrogenase [Variovorax sp. 770b2]|uniref:zinc-binding dehydrogenase n=1 Tax=Variovorax sp. 770b2 TaxID=1566271 RepID=UPI000B854A9A|nr:zinc-binding dehydrogenase [Variovorax sp. 770b2]